MASTSRASVHARPRHRQGHGCHHLRAGPTGSPAGYPMRAPAPRGSFHPMVRPRSGRGRAGGASRTAGGAQLPLLLGASAPIWRSVRGRSEVGSSSWEGRPARAPSECTKPHLSTRRSARVRAHPCRTRPMWCPSSVGGDAPAQALPTICPSPTLRPASASRPTPHERRDGAARREARRARPDRGISTSRPARRVRAMTR
jgi:hypothetical protein